MAHLPRFLAELAQECELDVIVERSDGPVVIPGARVHVQRAVRFRVLRILELASIVLRLRRAGCRRFFVRISVTAGLTIGVLGIAFPIELFYWNSGQSRNVLPTWRTLFARLRAEASYVPLRLVLHLADRLVTGPENMAAYYEREYGVPLKKISVVYNDIDPAPFREARVSSPHNRTSNDVQLLLFVGRISVLKGGRALVEILRRLRQRDAKVRCLAVGSVHLPDVIEAARGDLRNTLELVGPVPNNRLADYYAKATLFLLPSQSEGFPRVLLEAMAAALPIVAFDVGGVRDLLGPQQQRYVVPPADVDLFVARVLELLADPMRREELSRENGARVERYATPVVVRMFVERVVNDR